VISYVPVVLKVNVFDDGLQREIKICHRGGTRKTSDKHGRDVFVGGGTDVTDVLSGGLIYRRVSCVVCRSFACERRWTNESLHVGRTNGLVIHIVLIGQIVSYCRSDSEEQSRDSN